MDDKVFGVLPQGATRDSSNLMGDALKELEEVLGSATKEIEMEAKLSAEPRDTMSKTANKKKEDMAIKKGANQKGKRNALGRGLSALMTSNTLEVPISDNQVETDFAKASKAAILGGKANSVPRMLQVPKDSSGEPAAMSQKGKKSSGAAMVKFADIIPEDAPTRISVEPGADISHPVDRPEGLIEVALSSLIANPNQPRQHFSDAEIEELASSLKSSGLLQPILVRAHKSDSEEDGPKYEIIAGERRYRAAKKAGLTKVPALLRELDDREVLEVSIVENVQRSQLNAVEEAQAYARLQAEFGLSQEEVAKTIGKDRVTVANSLRLLKLSEKVQDMLIGEQLSAGHARALLMLETKAAQEKAAKRIVENLLSVRATEQLVRDSKAVSSTKKGKASSKAASANSSTAIARQALEDRFRQALGTKVALRLNSKGAGELKISFFSEEELEKLLDVVEA